MKVVIIGGRGTAINIADQMVDAHDRFGMDVEVLGLSLDDRSGGDSICGYPILCGIRELQNLYGKYEDVRYVYSLYRQDVMHERSKLLYSLAIPHEKFCNFVHPTVQFAKSSRMGYGNVLLAQAVVLSNTTLGNFNTFLGGDILGYGVSVGDNNYFGPNVCAGALSSFGNENFIGLVTSIRGSVSIGNNNLVGMGSVVTKDIADNSVVYGSPARVHRFQGESV